MAVLQVVLKTFLIKLFSWRFLFGCKMGSSSVLLSKMKPSINFSMGISVIVKKSPFQHRPHPGSPLYTAAQT